MPARPEMSETGGRCLAAAIAEHCVVHLTFRSRKASSFLNFMD